MPPVLGLTMGDPAGIGPEIILKSLELLAPRVAAGELVPVVVGTASCIAASARGLGLAIEIVERCDARDLAEGPGDRGGRRARADAAPGKLSAEGGRLAYAAIERAVAARAWPARSTRSSPRRSTRRR